MRGDVLVVVIGAPCWHPGSKVCWGDNRPSGCRMVGGGREGGVEGASEGPPFNITRPGFTHIVDN